MYSSAYFQIMMVDMILHMVKTSLSLAMIHSLFYFNALYCVTIFTLTM
uniref:Uncharacterized protein n=1 Tax=Rhizophora mucronata TaxID=61149 RepID=A0A2P2IU76_RHIMU